MPTKSAKRSSASKRHGEVLGIGRATKSLPRVKKSTATKRRRVKGIELTRARRRTMKRAGVVGGVRARGRG